MKIRLMFISAIIGSASSSAAFACDSITGSDNPTCAEWAPISGDVVEDKCIIAKLGLLRLQNEFDPTRQRTVADGPLPPREIILSRLKEGSDRVTRDCASDAASLP